MTSLLTFFPTWYLFAVHSVSALEVALAVLIAVLIVIAASINR